MEQQEIAAIVAAVGEQMQAQISATIAEALEPVLESVAGLEQKVELMESPGVGQGLGTAKGRKLESARRESGVVMGRISKGNEKRASGLGDTNRRS